MPWPQEQEGWPQEHLPWPQDTYAAPAEFYTVSSRSADLVLLCDFLQADPFVRARRLGQWPLKAEGKSVI